VDREPDDRWSSGRRYDDYMGGWSALVAPAFVRWLRAPADRRWVDVGCGTGALSRAILDLAKPASVVGIDPSGPFVEHAQATTTDPRARFAQGSADRTGLGDRTADLVVSGLVLNFVPDIGAALAEATRVVGPGGIVAGYVWDYADGMQVLRRFWDAAVARDPAAAALDEAARFPLAVPSALAELFEAAGLIDVGSGSVEVSATFGDFDGLWGPLLGGTGPAPAYVASLGAADRDALRDAFRDRLPIAADGRIELTARAWTVRGRTPPA
jgi:SAM-dependent methyltransferase